MAWLTATRLPRQDHQRLLDELCRVMKELDRCIDRSDLWVNKLFAEDPEAQRLETLPGVGKFGAVLVSNEIDGVDRFGSAKQLVAYAGLVPSTYSSGGRTFHGHLTKQGTKWLRWIFIQAVTPAVCSNPRIRSYYLRIRRRKGSQAARVATARRLLTIAFNLLKEKRRFVEIKSHQRHIRDKLNDHESPSNMSSGIAK